MTRIIKVILIKLATLGERISTAILKWPESTKRSTLTTNTTSRENTMTCNPQSFTSQDLKLHKTTDPSNKRTNLARIYNKFTMVERTLLNVKSNPCLTTSPIWKETPLNYLTSILKIRLIRKKKINLFWFHTKCNGISMTASGINTISRKTTKIHWFINQTFWKRPKKHIQPKIKMR